MNQATNIPGLFASKPKGEFTNPAQLIAPRNNDGPDFDQFLDAEVTRPHLDRTQRSSRREERVEQPEAPFTSRADRRTEARERVAPNTEDKQYTERTRPSASTSNEVPVVKASHPQQEVSATNKQPVSSEDKLVKALKDMEVEQERIDHVLSVLKQGPQSDEVMNALANLLTALSATQEGNPLQQLAGQKEGDANSPLGVLKSLFLEGSEHAQAAHQLTEQQQKLLDKLVAAGLTKEQAQNLMSAARPGSAAQNINAIRQQLNQSASQLAASEIPEGEFHIAGAQDKPLTGLENKLSENGPRITAGLENGLNKLATQNSSASQDGAHQNLNGNGGSFRPGGLAALGLNLNANAGSPAPGATAEGPVIQGVQASSDGSVKVSEVFKPVVAETYNPRGGVEKPIAQQIIDKFSLRGAGAQKEIYIRLDPPSLGTVRMNVSSNGDSVKTTIVAENQMVKQTIENNLGQLKDSMHSQGLKVDSFTVLVGGDQSQGMTHQQHETRQALRFFGSQHNLPVEGLPETVPQRQPVFFNDSQSISLFA